MTPPPRAALPSAPGELPAPLCAQHGAAIAELRTELAVVRALADRQRGTLATWGPTMLMAALALANLIELLLRKR